MLGPRLDLSGAEQTCARLSIVAVCFFPLGEALQPDYNPVAKCRQKAIFNSSMLDKARNSKMPRT